MQDEICTEVKSSVFKDYLISRGVRVLDNFEENRTDLRGVSHFEINNQLNALKEFHHRASGYDGYSRERIKTCIGKNIEKYKIELKKVKRDYKIMDKEFNKDSFQEFLLKCTKKNIYRAERCLKLINENGYMNLIMRSMREKEVCIGDSSFSNIRLTDAVEVISLDECGFNMIENDAIYFLRKLKRKGNKVDYYKVVDEFLRLEALDEKSRIYILALLSYPHEFMKYYSRLRKNKRGLNNFEWKYKMDKAMLMDGESLI